MSHNQVAKEESANDPLRVLILTPQGRDAALAEQTLARAGLATHVCADVAALKQEIALGAGAVLIAEEALPREAEAGDAQWFWAEPAWSSLPHVLLLGRGMSLRNIAALRALEIRPNVNFVERPVSRRSLVSAVRAAVEARRLQYVVRDSLEDLQIANRRKDEFLAMLSHELRNPLAPIRNAMFVLRKLEGESSDASAKRAPLLSMVERQVNHLVRLVDDLLEVSRITTGKIALKRQNVELAEVVRQATEISAPLIKRERHQLSVSLCEEPLHVDGDPVRLTQILSNLMNNAARYTPRGGHIDVSLQREGSEAVLRVQDDGIGIPESQLAQVFELFAQPHKARERKHDGLGIGLALVRGLVGLHGGTVAARSEGLDRGSEFIVRLPLAPMQEAPSERKPAALPALHLKALVVDDNSDVADSFAMLLESMGVEVRVAYSGADALVIVSEFAPRLAFLDLGMPGMDGFETARRIRSGPGGQGVVLVALSGWGRDDDRRRALEAGFSTHCVKPIDIETLRKLLAREPVAC
ncbi:MAG: hybrid sensor histidine kinase/response regulator [Methylocystis sp.]|nr:MAG: hybrid sensor histidine kinase/response regulator [Methylocystis sp.]